ncbi:MAG: Hsp70 family protein [Pseudomonadota bacterium]
MSSHTASVIGIGVDFGTSNSVAAHYDGTRVRIVDLGGGSRSMPSATYLDRELLAVTGQEAIDAYIDSNTGRRVELVSVLLGEGRMSTGSLDEGGIPQEAGDSQVFSEAMFDANQQGRLFYGIKRLLAAALTPSLPVFDRHYRLEALITPVLLRIRQAIAAEFVRLGTDSVVDHAVIGRPVHFERKGEGSNELAMQRLGTAFGNAGFADRHFCQEPVAAAINYLHSQPGKTQGMLLTVDFGGGTLDFSIFRDGPNRLQLLGTHGVALGGNHVDQLLFRRLLFPLLGDGEVGMFFTNEGYRENRFSLARYAELLLNWPVSYLLNQNRYLTPVLDMLKAGGETATKFQRLRDLIQFNGSYLVLEQLKAFKEAFATTDQVTLDLPELDINMTVDRAEFDHVLEPVAAQFEQALSAALQQAGVTADQIDRVVCVGGSTQLPSIKAVLARLFGDKVADHDIFTAVAAGLAIQDYLRQSGIAMHGT